VHDLTTTMSSWLIGLALLQLVAQALCAGGTKSGPFGNRCPTSPTNDTCFAVFVKPALRHSAQDQCRAIGGHLPFLFSKTEQDAFSTARSQAPELANVSLWTGGINSHGHGDINVFTWGDANRTRLSYTNWGPDEPNGEPSETKEACIVLGLPEKKDLDHWFDEPCAIAFPFICVVPSKVNDPNIAKAVQLVNAVPAFNKLSAVTTLNAKFAAAKGAKPASQAAPSVDDCLWGARYLRQYGYLNMDEDDIKVACGKHTDGAATTPAPKRG